MNKIWWTAFSIAALLAVTSQALADTDTDHNLQSRVATYWRAAFERDWETTYRMEKAVIEEDPSLNPFQYYGKKGAEPRYRNAKVVSVEQDGDTAIAVVAVAIIFPGGAAAFDVPKFYKSEWERVHGDWYHVQSRLSRPPLPDDGKATANAPETPESPTSGDTDRGAPAARETAPGDQGR